MSPRVVAGERKFAAELLGSSSSQSLHLAFNGPLPQTLAGGAGESLHLLVLIP